MTEQVNEHRGEQFNREAQTWLSQTVESLPVMNRNTDKANGDEFAKVFRGRAIWVPGLDWLLYDDRRWVQDLGLARYRLVDTLTDALRRASVEASEQQAEIYGRRVRRLESTPGVNGALTFAAARLEVPLRLLDANPLLINFSNGTYDAAQRREPCRWCEECKRGEPCGQRGLRKHKPEDYITRLCPIELHRDATDNTWKQVLHDVFNGEDRYEDAKLCYLQRFAGYTLTGLTDEKKVIVPVGPRDTAKSTVTEAIRTSLGDVTDGGYATTWSADVIQAGAQVNRPEKLDKARSARMVVAGELTKGSRMADGFVKQYSGGDAMDAKRLYKDSYTYRPQGKLWLPTNFVPRSSDKAMQGRLGLLPFRHVPKKLDPDVKKHLDTDDGAHRAVLAWAILGLEDYLDAREAGNEQALGETPWLDAMLAAYAHESDATLDFIEACFKEVEIEDLQPGQDDGSARVEAVWKAYEAWAKENVQKPLKLRTFEAALREHGFEKARVPSHGGTMRWRGLNWLAQEELPREVIEAVSVIAMLVQRG